MSNQETIDHFLKNYNYLNHIDNMTKKDLVLVLKTLCSKTIGLSNLYWDDYEEITILPDGYPTGGCSCGCCKTTHILLGGKLISEGNGLLDAIMKLPNEPKK